MNRSESIIVFILAVAGLVGCRTETPVVEETMASSCVRPDTPTLKTSTSLSGEKTVHDEQFTLRYGDHGASLDAQDPNMDIRDLQAFAITVYRLALKQKLQNGEKLNRGEVELLKFVCYVQHLSLSCFTAYGYAHLTRPSAADIGDFKDGPKKPKDDDATDFFKRSVSNFMSNGNVLAKLIDRWVEDVGSEGSLEIFREIVSPEYAKESGSKLMSPDAFFLVAIPMFGSSLYIYDCNKKDAANKPKDGEYVPAEYIQMFKDISVKSLNNRQKALLWGRVAESLRFYTQDLGELHRDLGMAIAKATDKKTKREVEDLRIKYSSWCEDDFYKFREVYYAYPFVKACNKLNDRVRDARHYLWFNNTAAMESAAMMFCETTSVKNNEMIKT